MNIYLLLFKDSSDFSHVISHLAKIAVGVAVILGIMLLLPRLARRSRKGKKQKKRHSGGFNRQQRRQESAIKRSRPN